jgi:hypothetical protein
MEWGEILLRTMMQVAFVAAGITWFLRRDPKGGMILILPIFFGIPAVLMSGFVLAPLETYLGQQIGLGAYPALVAIGVGAPWLLGLLRGQLGRGSTDGFLQLSGIFGAWALLWVATRPLHSWLFA